MREINTSIKSKLLGAFLTNLKVTVAHKIAATFEDRVRLSQFFGLSAYLVVWFGLFLTYKSLWGTETFPYKWFYILSISGYILVIVFLSLPRKWMKQFWIIILFIVFGIAVLQIFIPLYFFGYGDQFQLADMMICGVVFPRWLTGSAMLRYGYKLWTALPSFARYAGDFHAATLYAKILGGTIIMLISVAIIRKWHNRMSILLSVMSPIYLMFATGYDEYYPFAAGIFLLFLITIIEKDPAAQNIHWVNLVTEKDEEIRAQKVGVTWGNAYWLGTFLALLPAIYFPFIFFSLIALAYYWLVSKSTGLKAFAAFVAAYFALIYFLWPSSEPATYFDTLAMTTNSGDDYLFFTRYLGQYVGGNSIFFSVENALGKPHLWDLFYMLLWSGSLPILVLMGIGIYYIASRRILWKFIASTRTPLLMLLLAWQIYYFVFMIPRLGPKVDIDLFFSFYICLAFITGHVWDYLKDQTKLDREVDNVIIPVAISNAIVTLFFLLVAGIPEII